MRIRWSPRARDQAREIFEQIARSRPDTAERILDGFIERVRLLRESPEQGPWSTARTESSIAWDATRSLCCLSGTRACRWIQIPRAKSTAGEERVADRSEAQAG